MVDITQQFDFQNMQNQSDVRGGGIFNNMGQGGMSGMGGGMGIGLGGMGMGNVGSGGIAFSGGNAFQTVPNFSYTPSSNFYE